MDMHASAGNRTRVTSMATMYSTTRPLMLLVLVSARTTQTLARPLRRLAGACCSPCHISAKDGNKNTLPRAALDHMARRRPRVSTLRASPLAAAPVLFFATW